MHPGFYAWWKSQSEADCGPNGCGPNSEARGEQAGPGGRGDERGGEHGHGHGHGPGHGGRGPGRGGWGRWGAHMQEHMQEHMHEHARAFFGGHMGHGGPGGPDHDHGNAFGVRRPLRFLAHKLELNEAQVATFATLLDELKTERAQAAVDHRRRISALADAIETPSFDDAKAQSAGETQVKSAQSVRDAVDRALRKMHAALDDEQRKKLAYMLRTGALSV